jgi:hypothetical protein
MDEARLVAALTDVLRQKRQALLDSDLALQGPSISAATNPLPEWLAPIWQPLLDDLDLCTARWQDQGRNKPAVSAELAASVSALSHEYEGLQHTLALWSAAIKQAMELSAQRPPEPVYGPGYGHSSPQRLTLGRG